MSSPQALLPQRNDDYSGCEQGEIEIVVSAGEGGKTRFSKALRGGLAACPLSPTPHLRGRSVGLLSGTFLGRCLEKAMKSQEMSKMIFFPLVIFRVITIQTFIFFSVLKLFVVVWPQRSPVAPV